MYVHLGAGTSVSTRNIVGVFDLENSTLSKTTRNFLKGAEDSFCVTDVCEGMPKTFVVWEKNGEVRVYISMISSATLQKRMRNVSFTGFKEG